MVSYEALQADRRRFLVLTGLTLPEFQRLLTAFPRAYQRIHPASQTTEGQLRRRSVGGGRKGLLHRPEDKLLFILVYIKTYPLQAVMGELFILSQPHQWLRDVKLCFWFPSARSAKALPPAPRPIRNRRVTSQG